MNNNNRREKEEVQNARHLREYLHPTHISDPSCFVFPTNAPNFNIKVRTIQNLPQFNGLESKNSYLHMKEFEKVCGACKIILK